MEISEQQLTKFKELYKKEFDMDLTDAEAQERALALLRFLSFSIIPFEPEKDKVEE